MTWEQAMEHVQQQIYAWNRYHGSRAKPWGKLKVKGFHVPNTKMPWRYLVTVTPFKESE
jgi:hypothetical protein